MDYEELNCDSDDMDSVLNINTESMSMEINDETTTTSTADMKALQQPCGQNNNKKQVGKPEGKELVAAGTANTTSKSKKKRRRRVTYAGSGFKYGNFYNYYNYRNSSSFDKRLLFFLQNPELFYNKSVLDVGCNCGYITIEIAKKLRLKSIHGVDIDRSLVRRATGAVNRMIYKIPGAKVHYEEGRFPFNVTFEIENYVIEDEQMLAKSMRQYDLILCLSVTKWVHLNFGDHGVKQLFKRMFMQLKPGGMLILEPQPYKSYAKRKRMTEEIAKNYELINFYPRQFMDYLLSPEVGFDRVSDIGIPANAAKGYRRPIQIFIKK